MDKSWRDKLGYLFGTTKSVDGNRFEPKKNPSGGSIHRFQAKFGKKNPSVGFFFLPHC
jgi:hypothetical protein